MDLDSFLQEALSVPIDQAKKIDKVQEATKATYSDLASLMIDIKSQIDGLEDRRKKLQKQYDLLRRVILPAKAEKDSDDGSPIVSMKIKGLGRLRIEDDAFVNIKGGQQAPVYQWMETNGYGDIVVPYIHPSTLKATIMEMVRQGQPLPPNDLVSFTPFSVARVTKT